MTTLTQIVATVVVHSSAAALSHFGVTLEPAPVSKTPVPVERVVARTPAAPAKALDGRSAARPAPTLKV